MSLRILQVVTDTDRRGAQVFASDLHAALVPLGFEVRTVALAPGTEGGLDLCTLGTRRRGTATLRGLRHEATISDVVVAHGSTTLPACAVALVGAHVPFVYRQISDSRFWAPGGLRRARVRLGLARAARVVALWPGAADTLEQHFGVRRDRIQVIPNGVPPARFPPAPAGAKPLARSGFGLAPERSVVLYAGALVPEKGVDVAIEAVGALSETQLIVVGAGPELARLETLAKRVAPGRVVFAGSVVDPADAYAAADLVVLPSRGGDSMPAVLIEAAFMAIPAVATPIAGIPEIVRPGVTGELVPAGDAAALAGAVDSILVTPGRASVLGRAARAHCLEHFAIDRVATQWAAVLQDVAVAR